MPPHLHPRSFLTTSLFGTTLAVSFLVVGLPHLLPCPVPKSYADSQDSNTPNQRRRWRRNPLPDGDEEVQGRLAGGAEGNEGFETARERECPVPKPGGLIGTVLGFQEEKAERPVVRIAPLAEKRSRPRIEGEAEEG
ncbi:alpha-1-3-mannosyltransferase (Alg3) [Venturia nashicola]|uniref:Alpha-1-3-mannosyltransferase (Alg3) n=1 Tax=Venturia nashicola TaxID=86259 RepID=A0A4Z1PJ34_9PEZI|nr:alpha-1-3-mannosyltransferase (Alg3) [Venturia nashicola]